MYKLIIVIALGSCLFGCATTANYQQVLNHWQGARFKDLVSVWGCPEVGVKAVANGNKIYLYKKQQQYTTAPAPAFANTPFVNVNGTPMATTAFTGNFGGTTITRYCLTWFEVNSAGIIVGSRFQGNNCIASRPNSLVP